MIRPAPGFTLLELLVVLAIAGFLMAVVPPLISAALPGVETQAAARKLAAGLRFARGQAVYGGTPAALTLDLDHAQFTLSGQGRPVSLPARVKLHLTTVYSERLGEHQGAIRFFPDGSSTGGRIRVSLGRSGYDVDVAWLTGRVEVRPVSIGPG
ncbi:general secretion pathway protein H [Gammaproteobacteria bacterium]